MYLTGLNIESQPRVRFYIHWISFSHVPIIPRKYTHWNNTVRTKFWRKPAKPPRTRPDGFRIFLESLGAIQTLTNYQSPTLNEMLEVDKRLYFYWRCWNVLRAQIFVALLVVIIAKFIIATSNFFRKNFTSFRLGVWWSTVNKVRKIPSMRDI